MIIANPIYDVVFKYLLDDLEIAKELLSTILDIKIEHLVVKSQEELVKTETGDIRIFRLDFKAIIQLENGEKKKVLIELQKAKQSYDIVRFRKYLAKNYLEEDEVIQDEHGQQIGVSLEIITIYFLGFTLKNVPIPILKVQRSFMDAVTKRTLEVEEDFINLLTHESYTIQIPRLKLKQQNDMEQVLEIFNQENVTEDKHRIDYQGKPENPLVKKMVRRLTKAAADAKLSQQMDAEDAVDRLLNRERAKYEDALKEKDAMLKEKDAKLEEKDAMLGEKDAKLEEKDAKLEEKDAMLEQFRLENEQLKAMLKEKN